MCRGRGQAGLLQKYGVMISLRQRYIPYYRNRRRTLKSVGLEDSSPIIDDMRRWQVPRKWNLKLFVFIILGSFHLLFPKLKYVN